LAAVAANQIPPRPPISGIHLIAIDIRRAQANIDAARIAANDPLVEVEQNLLTGFRIELR
jgi:hypothetical protein